MSNEVAFLFFVGVGVETQTVWFGQIGNFVKKQNDINLFHVLVPCLDTMNAFWWN